MWLESSSASAANLVKNLLQFQRYKFFPRPLFLLAHPVEVDMFLFVHSHPKHPKSRSRWLRVWTLVKKPHCLTKSAGNFHVHFAPQIRWATTRHCRLLFFSRSLSKTEPLPQVAAMPVCPGRVVSSSLVRDSLAAGQPPRFWARIVSGDQPFDTVPSINELSYLLIYKWGSDPGSGHWL